MNRRHILIGFLGIAGIAGLQRVMALRSTPGREGANDVATSGDGPWPQVTLRVVGMT